MIADPYRVLGIPESASDTELKKAYRDLSKRYHPDANPDDPDGAEERFKEIQEAYKQIMDARERGTSAYGPAPGSYGSSRGDQQGRPYAEYGSFFGGFDDFFRNWQAYSEQERARQSAGERNELTAARNYINSGHYQEALQALSGVPMAERTAQWFYYSAVANQSIGNNIQALNHAKRAVDLEPGNNEYRSFLQRLQSGGQWYTHRGEGYGGMRSLATTGICLSICALNMCCGAGGLPMMFCC